MIHPAVTSMPRLAAVALAGCAAACAGDHQVTHGAAVGEVTDRGAVIWARTQRAGVMHVRLDGPRGRRHFSREVAAAHDYTGVIALDGLVADSRYDWTVWFSGGHAAADPPYGRRATGRFRTAAAVDRRAPVAFGFGGDLAGQNVCRDAAAGFPILPQLAELELDFFIALGDMIYADSGCAPLGRYGNLQLPGPDPTTELAGFWAHWKYGRADAGHQRLLAGTPMYAVWDDHEVVNDFDSATPSLPAGLRAFLDYNPLPRDAGTRLYRRVRRGRHLELFLLDNRQYRDPNAWPDTGARPKTMLGEAQRDWLIAGLAASDATWKVVVSSVPMSIPTGASPPESGRDGWANYDQDTGFERELLVILDGARRAGVRNLLWLTTDVHFAAVFRYTPFADAPTFRVHEVAVGPLCAGLFPQYDFDTTLAPEQLFFHGPVRTAAVTSWADALGWMNAGLIDIDAGGGLRLRILDGTGAVVYRLDLPPAAPGQ
jgi:alkaline phosphatase D